MSTWLKHRWYDVVFWSSFLLFTFGWSIRIIGRRNMPKEGPILVISNHQSFFDPVLIGLASQRYLCFLARQSLFKSWFFSRLIRSLDAIAIDNKGMAKEGLQATLNALATGRAVLVFAEGERTSDGEVEPFQPGISLLLKKLKAPIVPIGMVGCFEAWSRHEKLPTPSPLFLSPTSATMAISIGEPIDPSIYHGMSREAMLTDLRDRVLKEMEKAMKVKRGHPHIE
jgi:1-acyl-sn-glycerol-3-phosphate acyltransferase